ncbi:MAG: hypothetical protein HC924_14935 [Synechococcaceae cyanobacterium SM2_3_2]|nr:hypothetical protein [Synechococcaceae cyanobacterium SM2_3_2]
MSNSSLTDNRARDFGGGIRVGVTATVSNSTLKGNTAGSGGGIFALNVTVSNSTLSSNSAGSNGGGINTGTVMVNNSTLSGNSAGTLGGGIAAGTAAVSNSTLSGNSAGSSGGGGIGANTATVSNSIISGNSTSASGNRECNTGVAAASFNLFGFNNDEGGCPTTGSNIVPSEDVNQILDSLADNGGFIPGAPGSTVTIQTQSLPAGSPAINAGDPNFKTPPDFDQRGSGFPRIVNTTVDIGAFEVQ